MLALGRGCLGGFAPGECARKLRRGRRQLARYSPASLLMSSSLRF
jgi:hypothetical protein